MSRRDRLQQMLQGEVFSLAYSLLKDIPRIHENTIVCCALLGCNLTPKQVLIYHPEPNYTLTTVYKINSRFKDTIDVLKRESHQLYKAAGLIIE
ncbi:hypothetical protein EXA18_00590 [Vibrio cincinnatiensis]|uniref:hypothetical protein n=1 Tax=Vibrio cincinnatiensis TaxID=675 RepID=UPI001EDCCD4B|nr:hypothetical protein [Vibrio cincinnatiensis]MCG3741980.1 hypothetical protein [Vibrio cincinnatiensis]